MQEQEIIELINMAHNHNAEAMETLMQSFKPKVIAIAREYFLIGAEFDDLIQEGMIGLFNAITAYDANKNHNFSSFASLCIHRKVQNAYECNKIKEYYIKYLGYISIENAYKNAKHNKRNPLNSYIPINNFDDHGDDEEKLKLVIVDDESNFEQNFIDKEMTTILISRVKDLLNEKEFRLLKKFLNGETYDKMAQEMKLTLKQMDNTLQAIKRKLKTLKGEI